MGNLIFQWKKTNYPCLDIIQSNIFVLQTTKDTLTRYWSSRVSFISAEAPSKKFMRLINFQHRSSKLSKPISLITCLAEAPACSLIHWRGENELWHIKFGTSYSFLIKIMRFVIAREMQVGREFQDSTMFPWDCETASAQNRYPWSRGTMKESKEGYNS